MDIITSESIFKGRNFTYLGLPFITSFILQVVFYAILVFNLRQTIVFDRELLFWSSFISSFILVLYTEYTYREKKIEHLPQIVLGLYVLLSLLIVSQFIQERIDINFLALLLFIQFQLMRLLRRLVYGGFPAVTFLLNLVVMYFITHGISIVFIPFLYIAIQLFENIFHLNYSGLGRIYEKSFSVMATVLFYFFLIIMLYPDMRYAIFLVVPLLAIFIVLTRDYLKRKRV